MNLSDEILLEHSKRQKDKIVRWVGDDKNRFAELMNLFLRGEYRVTQRAAWSISYCVGNHPPLAKPWLRKMLLKTQEPGVHGSVKRNVLRLLQDIEIPKSLFGLAANISFQFLSNAKEPIAVRVFSMSVLAKIAKHEPDLKNELKMMIEDLMHHESAGIKSRGRKVLKELAKF